MFSPRRSWRAVLAAPKDASWLYLIIGLESLLMRPSESVRAIWAVSRRGAPHVMSVLRLGAMQIAAVLLGTYVLAFLFRIIMRRNAGRLEMGTYAAILPWAYVPKIVVTCVFVVLWALKIAPDSAMAYALAPWNLVYHVLSFLAIGASLVAFFSIQNERVDWAGSTSNETPLWQRGLPGVLLLLACGFVAFRVQSAPAVFRPIGQGDRVNHLVFAPLGGEPAIDLTFPRDKPVVIDFWATWCGPCVAALPDWQSQYLRRDQLGADLVSANVELDNLPEVTRFVRSKGFLFPVNIADANTQSLFQVTSLPTMLVLSRQGDIVEYWVGAHDASDVANAVARAR
jgi:thiol-disulfide isomerase/thioredoxin